MIPVSALNSGSANVLNIGSSTVSAKAVERGKFTASIATAKDIYFRRFMAALLKKEK
jgi:hypothetical protein